MNTKRLFLSAVCGSVVSALLVACQGGAELEALKQKLAEVEKARQTEEANLANFDDLDFRVYSGQKWDELGKSHAQDITVHWPDGRTTAVTGYMEGTFSQPMRIADGKTMQPTGKAFKVSMVTIGHWKDGVMDEEWLMWDNQAFMKQIGLVQ